MGEIINISNFSFAGEKEDGVNARDLHRALEVKTEFSHWLRRRTKDAQLIEGVDFCSFVKIDEREIGATVKKECALTIDAAKHIALMEKTDKGKEIRKYFIEHEKRSRKLLQQMQLNNSPTTQAKIAVTDILDIAKLLNCPPHIAQVEACKQAKMISGVDVSHLLTYSPDQDDINEDEMMLEPSNLADLLGIEGATMTKGKKVNEFLASQGLQYKVNKKWKPTDHGKKYCAVHQWQKGPKTDYNLKWNVAEVKKRWYEKQEDEYLS